MLSGLAAGAAITALIAGIAGAWSPCGFSMLDTIGSALGDARRLVTALAVATFTLGALAGGVVTFGGLALVGSLAGHGSGALRDALGGALALAAAFADWNGVRIAPQIRRQVPERWRWIMPLPLACALYGVLLGLGFTTFVLAFAVWALAGISVVAGSLGLGLLLGVAFGLGRALPIIWLAPGLHSERGRQRLERLAIEPRLWLGMRRLGALGLTLCAALLVATPAFGHAAAPSPALFAASATDPAVDGALAAWQAVGGSGVLRGATGATTALPGSLPALGGANVAWVAGGTVVVANATTLSPEVSVPLGAGTTVAALAISDSWLVISELPAAGGAVLVAVPLPSLGPQSTLASAALAGEIGRPSIDGSDVVFALGGPRHSKIEQIDLASGAATVLRSTGKNDSFLNPSLAAGRLLYERIGRCEQTLLLGPPQPNRQNKQLLSVPSTVIRDPGWQVGYTHAYNSASLCPNRGARRGGKLTLGSTALDGRSVYFGEYRPNGADARILTLPLGG